MCGNVCDANANAGIAIISSRYGVIADNVLTANSSGVSFLVTQSTRQT